MSPNIEKMIANTLQEAEEFYQVEILSSWVAGSRHLGLANETSDIDVIAVFIQDPIESLRQKVSPKYRLTTYISGLVEVKLISLKEFARDIKKSSALAFETLFSATVYEERILTLNGALQDLYFDLKDTTYQKQALCGIVCSIKDRFNANKQEGLDTPVKLLVHATKYSLMGYLSYSKDRSYFNETVNLLKVATEDPEVPQVIKDVFKHYNSPELYRGNLDEEGEHLFNKLLECNSKLLLTHTPSSRNNWGEEEYRAADAKVDNLVMKYYRDIFYY